MENYGKEYLVLMYNAKSENGHEHGFYETEAEEYHKGLKDGTYEKTAISVNYCLNKLFYA